MVVIDFTVTRTGLEEQLLGVVINQEKAELEEILNNLMSEINQNVARLKDLDEKLLETLAAADKEKILEDKELVDMLSKVKSESKKVESTIKSAEENKIQINKQRKE
jgi:septal ring factor EnvC (AmiA/AmiB activator)